MAEHSPRRIQLRRARGWRKPADTVVVARPSVWGNPYIIGADGDRATCVRRFRELLTSRDGPNTTAVESAVLEVVRQHLSELRGKNLACWCPLDEPCHADVLLELANR